MVPTAGAAARPDFTISAPSRFSPNGDGVKDTLKVRYTLPRRTHVHLTIGGVGTRRVHRTVDLGTQPRGTHVWTWDGRNQSGRDLPDKHYVIRMYGADPAGHPTPLASATTELDTAFAAELTTPTFGAGRTAVARVYPRTTVSPTPSTCAPSRTRTRSTSLELVIRNDKGRVVRRADVDEPIPYATGGGVFAIGRTVPGRPSAAASPFPRGATRRSSPAGTSPATPAGRSR